LGDVSGKPPTPQRQKGNSARRLLKKATKSLIHKYIKARLAQNAGRVNMQAWRDHQGLSLRGADKVSGAALGEYTRSAMIRLCGCLIAAPAFADDHGVSGNANVRSGVLKW
jgi:hypothetical protein